MHKICIAKVKQVQRSGLRILFWSLLYCQLITNSFFPDNHRSFFYKPFLALATWSLYQRIFLSRFKTSSKVKQFKFKVTFADNSNAGGMENHNHTSQVRTTKQTRPERCSWTVRCARAQHGFVGCTPCWSWAHKNVRRETTNGPCVERRTHPIFSKGEVARC